MSNNINNLNDQIKENIVYHTAVEDNENISIFVKQNKMNLDDMFDTLVSHNFSNSSVIREFLDQANMSKNKRLIKIQTLIKIIEMGEDENPEPKSENEVVNRKRSLEPSNKDKPVKKRQDINKNDEPYVFLKRGLGIKFTKPPKAFERQNNKTGKFLHSFVEGKYVGRFRNHAIALDKLMRKGGAKDLT